LNILLVEAHALIREGLASTFEQEAGFEVVGQAESIAQARQVLVEGEQAVDVALIDPGLPDGDGSTLIPELREANPPAQALVLSASFDRAEIARAVEMGAAGVLHKSAPLDEVKESVRRLGMGQTLPLEEVIELLRFAGKTREVEYKARQAIKKLTPEK
jgi:DNA-binding NarL/FixJ family response regulator